MKNQKGSAPILILVAIIGVVAFLAVSSSAPFKNNLLSSLFPKDASHAAGNWAFEEKWDLGGTPGVSVPILWNDPAKWDVVSDSNDPDGIMDAQTIPENTQSTDGVLEMGHGPHCEAPYNDAPGGTQNPATNNHNVTVDFDVQRFQQNIRPQLTYICNNHLMTVAKSGYGIVSMMPRQMFDWNGRTGTIEFETNTYSDGREWWDVYITPKDQMLLQMANLNEGGNYEQNPKTAIKFKYGGEGKPGMTMIENYEEPYGWDAPQGFEQLFTNDPANTNPKIRRLIRLQLSQTNWKFGIQVDPATAPANAPGSGTYETGSDGIKMWVNSGTFPHPVTFTQGLIRLEHHAYNPSKDYVNGVPWSQYTYHWENFHFDGPVIPAMTAFEPGPHFVDLFNKEPGAVSQPVKINVNVAASDIKNPVLVGHIISDLNLLDATNATSFEQVRVNGGPWMKVQYVKDVDPSNYNPGKPRTWSTFRNTLNNVVPGDNTIEFKFASRPSTATWQRNSFNAKDLEIQIDPVGFIPPPSPSIDPNATPTPSPSPIPSPSPSPLPSPQSGPTLGFNTQGSIFDTDNANHLNASRFLRGSAGTITSMSVFVGNVGTAPNNQYSLAIYSDNSGTPGSLISSSGSGTLTANSWNTLPISANLTANTWYWLAFNTNGTSQQLNNGAMNTNYQGGLTAFKTQTFGTWPTSFGTPASTTPNAVFSIYATISGSSASPSPSAQASVVPSPSPLPSASAKPGDIDGNNKVDIFDYNILLTNFGKTGTGIQGDFDNNGKVDIFDFNTLLSNFGK